MKLRIKEMRYKKGWTQAQTAQQTGISLDYVRSLEIGRAEPSLRVANKLKEAFGCNCIDDLIETA